MIIASCLAEGRPYVTGGGSCVFTLRREKMYAYETGVEPTSRPKFDPPDQCQMYSTETVAKCVAENAHFDNPDTQVTVIYAQKEYPFVSGTWSSAASSVVPAAAAVAAEVPATDEFDPASVTEAGVTGLVVKMQEIRFNEQSAVTSCEIGVSLVGGGYQQATLDLTLSNYDGLEPKHYDDDDDLLQLALSVFADDSPREESSLNDQLIPVHEIDPNEEFAIRMQTCGRCKYSKMGSDKAYCSMSNGIAVHTLRTVTEGQLFQSVESMLPDVRVHIVANFRPPLCAAALADHASVRGGFQFKRSPSNRSQFEDEDVSHQHKCADQTRRPESYNEIPVIAAPFEAMQQTDAEAVKMITSRGLRRSLSDRTAAVLNTQQSSVPPIAPGTGMTGPATDVTFRSEQLLPVHLVSAQEV
jgi:hypothetical protein